PPYPAASHSSPYPPPSSYAYPPSLSSPYPIRHPPHHHHHTLLPTPIRPPSSAYPPPSYPPRAGYPPNSPGKNIPSTAILTQICYFLNQGTAVLL
ncbi:hypothetical protein L195_g035428, partial [Trifolium pratense]